MFASSLLTLFCSKSRRRPRGHPIKKVHLLNLQVLISAIKLTSPFMEFWFKKNFKFLSLLEKFIQKKCLSKMSVDKIPTRPATPLEEAGDYYENYWTKEKLVR